MKKISFLLIAFILWFSFSACESPKNIPQKYVGKHVFDILTTLDTLDKEAFRTHFITLDEIKNVLEEVAVSDEFRDKASTMDVDTYNKDIDRIYHDITQEAIDNYVHLSQIEYLDYEYKATQNNSMIGYTGTLYFKANNQTYRIKVYSMEFDDAFGLLGLGRLKREEERTFE
ncbi:hypothetical protein U8527_14725 [Kordia algicida OT-1]|uniref:DUF5104 domain-containing protein n=1 Tax=Kordia algicida OT-1 TaxID=391587 RepID=A9DYP8_9FLAO|nr:hypothetical protein [Kordia algicida]EDP96162.1 hypothetical protein KAOT1_08333 [Kordia algicida OT-1]